MRGVSMKIKLLGTALALAVAAAPIAAVAGGVSGGNANSNWTIYGWQNWSYEWGSADVASDDPADGGERDRDFSRIDNNAANIGFAATIDTGMSMGGEAIKANFQCEQFTFHNRFNGSGFSGFNDFCNRNSKISLSGAFGELMMGQWLLPYNEMVAQWIDPFYDAGADSHTSIMGSVGYGTRFFNGGFGFDANNFGGALNQGFNRRQNGIVQYFSPNINGFTFRLATSNATNGDTDFEYFGGNGDIQIEDSNGEFHELDPRIWSTGVAYENTLASGDNIWFAATYEKHDEWAAVDFRCSDSDDDSYRFAGRYIHQWGNGMFTRISAMWETLEYDWDDCDGGTLLSDNTSLTTNTTDLELERDAWMVSGIQNFGNGFDVRFSYMDADDFDCDTCDVSDSSTGGKAYNVGLFYTMPAGTELRLTYSDVDNDSQANYDYGINPAGVVVGGDTDQIAVGIVQWF